MIKDLQVEIDELQQKYDLYEKETSCAIELLLSEKLALEETCSCFQEELNCAKNNLAYKKTEISSLNEQLELLQDEVGRLRMELNSFNTTEEHGAKGNSLFAEVDDRRLKLEEVVRNQRTKYLTMRREHAKSSKEIAQLCSHLSALDENIASLKSEIGLEDRSLINTYKLHIGELDGRIKDLENQLHIRDNIIAETAKKDYNAWVANLMKNCEISLKAMQERLNNKCLECLNAEQRLRWTAKESQRYKMENLNLQSDYLQLELKYKACQAHMTLDNVGSSLVNDKRITAVSRPIHKVSNIDCSTTIKIKTEKLEDTQLETRSKVLLPNPFVKPFLYKTDDVKPTVNINKNKCELNDNSEQVLRPNVVFQEEILMTTIPQITSIYDKPEVVQNVKKSILRDSYFQNVNSNPYSVLSSENVILDKKKVCFTSSTHSPKITDRKQMKENKKVPKIVPMTFIPSAEQHKINMLRQYQENTCSNVITEEMPSEKVESKIKLENVDD